MIQQHGLLILNKPRGFSSAQCTNRLKRLGQKKLGHAGTLDPMATGVLLVLLGQATKISGHLMAGGAKTYLAVARLGQTTDTWDAEGALVAEAPWEHVDPAEVTTRIESWHGVLEQEVPPYSAAKHQGQALYKLSRAGKETPVKVKNIEISQAEVLRVELPFVTFRVTCSSGTYIRSLAHSLGKRLGCGAVLTELTREYSHPFDLQDAHDLADILDRPETLPDRVLPVSAGLPHWRAITLDAEQERAVRHGASTLRHDGEPGEKVLLQNTCGELLALAEAGFAAERAIWSILRGLWQEPNPTGG